MSGIQAKAVVKYVLLPGIIPRLRQLFASGFGHIAFLMAQIYAMVRLLPAQHPYLDPANIGHFGIRHVIAEAANNLIISRKNIDQIVIFILLLTSIVLLGLQLIILILSLIFGSAIAGPLMPPGDSMFVTANPAHDIALMLLDQVFGAGQFFGSCVATSVLCDGESSNPPYPWPFHLAIQQLFRFYSTGILIVGTLIFLYFVVVVTVETATTGHPFGQRFQNIWVPIRLVVAIGLLIPLGYGYNAGQYITFAAAKYGSGFATYAWLEYNNAIAAEMGPGANPLGEKETMIGLPKPPDATVMAEFISIVHTCAFSYYAHSTEIKKGSGPGGVPLPDPTSAIPAYLNRDLAIKPYFVKNRADWMSNKETRMAINASTTYEEALKFFERGNIVFTFGRQDDNRFSGEVGQVEPTCGEVEIKVHDRRLSSDAGTGGYLGPVEVQKFFFNLIRDHWFNTASNENYIDFAGRRVLKTTNLNLSPCEMGCSPDNPKLPSCSEISPDKGKPRCHVDDIGGQWKQDAINKLQEEINTEMIVIWSSYSADTTEMALKPEILEKGWGGAGIWFNSIAQLNGPFVTSLMDFPSLKKYPKIMEEVQKQNKANNKDNTGSMFDPNLAAPTTMSIGGSEPDALAIANELHSVHQYWNPVVDSKNQAKSEKIITSGALETAMNLVFGTYGLFSMVDENTHVHPLAQLVTLGKGLVEHAIRNIAGATLSAVLGGAAKAFEVQAGPLADAFSKFLTSTAFIGLTAGFVLFYIIPFLPFVYFYFAVATWIKSIFEAMVGVPLWALAHLRLDGEGLPGEAASNGYFLIFEIFLRPILSVAGLIAALFIFTAQVRVLHFIWGLVTENVGGFNGDPTIGIVENLTFKRTIIDEFFFTVLYAIIVYMLATASFKLIDRIPDNILRWFGSSASAFSDINQDPTESLTRYAALGGMTAGQQAAGGFQELGGGVGRAIGGVGKGPAP